MKFQSATIAVAQKQIVRGLWAAWHGCGLTAGRYQFSSLTWSELLFYGCRRNGCLLKCPSLVVSLSLSVLPCAEVECLMFPALHPLHPRHPVHPLPGAAHWLTIIQGKPSPTLIHLPVERTGVTDKFFEGGSVPGNLLCCWLFSASASLTYPFIKIHIIFLSSRLISAWNICAAIYKGAVITHVHILTV